jgi:hypothetical protein
VTGGRRPMLILSTAFALLTLATAGWTKDLGDILVQKGLITPEELRQAREEDKQKSAAEESRRDAIVAKLPGWLSMITPFGDLRIRDEGFYAKDLIGRNRFRFRARVGLNINPNDEIGATFRVASGDPNDPISANQSFQNVFTKKSVNFDQAYLTLRPGKTFNLQPGIITVLAGKFGVPNYRVSEMVWDDDLSPEGFSESVAVVDNKDSVLRGLKINGYQWIIDEVANGGDPNMVGGQVVSDWAFTDDAEMTFAFADYSYQNVDQVARKFLEKTSSSFNSSLANSNRVDHFSNAKISGFKSGFNIVNPNGEFNVTNVPVVGGAGIFGDLAYNTLADSKALGFSVGFGFGHVVRDWYHDTLKNQGDWGFSYTFEHVEQDAVFSMFSMSDLDYVQQNATQKGSSNQESHIIRLDYMLLPSLQLTAKAEFINVLDRASANVTLHGNDTLLRSQLDATLRF